jgi:hypothetical protein
MTVLPDDIKAAWLSPIRRLQSVASQQRGLAIISINILVDETGNPLCWTNPKKVLIEPKNRARDIINGFMQGLGEVDTD